ncbi:zinc-finger protein [Parahypoxylon ruwenzoriense]
MTIYARMDGSIDPNDDANFELPSLTSSPSEEGYNSSMAPSSHNFETNFPFTSSSYGTVEPASLELFHTSHDDSCLDKCLGTYNPQGVHRGTYTTPFPTRTRLSTSSFSYSYHLPENNGFQIPTQQFSHVYTEAFPDMCFNRYGLNDDTKPNHHPSSSEPHIGNHFNATDLGGPSQCPVPDDCVSVNCSKYSCSSECCSTQVCQEESCSGEGTPCDDMHCLDHVSQSLGNLWDMSQGWQPSIQPDMNHALHNQPCNHTNTEHDVAITLRDLSVPGISNIQQQQHGLPQFECHLLSTADHPTDSARVLSLSVEPHQSFPPTPDMSPTPTYLGEGLEGPDKTTKHVCQWIICGTASEADKVCGHVCQDSSSLQDHLCHEHIALLSSKTKYLCLWKGCSRRGDQVFASRNKLRRHIATHTAYKPHKCDICGEGFSAQQALDQHIRTHTGEKPYKCDVEGCDKSFKQKSALSEKPLKCEICGKCFCESSNLSKHRKTHNPDFKFKCDEPGCDSQFIRIDQLRRHQARHERQRKKQRARTTQGPALSPIPPGEPQNITSLLDNE